MARDSELTARRSKARPQLHSDQDSGPEPERNREEDADAEAEAAESASTSHTSPTPARDESSIREPASSIRKRRASHPIEVEDARPHQNSSASGASASATAGDWANEDDEAGFAVEWSVPECKSEFELELEAGVGGGHQVQRPTAGPGRISRPSGTEPVELFAAPTPTSPTSSSRHPSSTSTSTSSVLPLLPPGRRPSGEQHAHAHAEGSLLEATDAADLDDSIGVTHVLIRQIRVVISFLFMEPSRGARLSHAAISDFQLLNFLLPPAQFSSSCSPNLESGAFRPPSARLASVN